MVENSKKNKEIYTITKESPKKSKPSLSIQKNLKFTEYKKFSNSDFEVPSRESILYVLRNVSYPILDSELKNFLKITERTCNGFEKRLSAMEHDGQLIRSSNGMISLSKVSFISGKVEGHPDGFGFLLRDDEKTDLYLPYREMLKVFHGDKVLAKLEYKNRGKCSARIVEIIKRKQVDLVGSFYKDSNLSGKFIPNDQRIRRDILIPEYGINGAKDGQIVSVRILEYPTREKKPIAYVREILGNFGDPGIEIEISIRKFGISDKFSREAINQARTLPKYVRKTDLINRVDLRDVPFITIDGEDSLDFDDAIYCEPVLEKDPKSNWKLLVAISDVSYYVKPNCFLDYEALKRGTSIYFPRRVVPMLPEELSNGLCSLSPNVDRLVLVCEMVIFSHGEKSGTVASYKFYDAIINSHSRTTYNDVSDVLSLKKSERKKVNELAPLFGHLHSLYLAFSEAKRKRGAINFDITEPKLVCNHLGQIEKIVLENRNDAYRIIEECMLAANTCAADFIAQTNHPGLYRVHDCPTKDRLYSLQEFLKSLDINLMIGTVPKAKDYNDFLDLIRNRPDFNIIQSMCLRSMQQAVYSSKNTGHFGLAYSNYIHFTSPIRRYPDLLIHRIIKSILQGGSYTPNLPLLNTPQLQKHFPEFQKGRSIWENLALLFSLRERRSDEVSRDVAAQLKCSFAKKRMGTNFKGTIVSVTSFGIFVMIDHLQIEGLIHISELGQDKFQFNEVAKKLHGIRTGICYSLSDLVEVQIKKVDTWSRKIELSLIKKCNFSIKN